MEEIETMVKVNGVELFLERGIYPVTNQTRLRLFTAEGKPSITATVAVEHIELNSNEVIIKDYSENVGVLKALKEAEVIDNVTERVKQGFVTLHICDLLI